MPGWSFLTNHARALACIAHDPGVRLIDIASTLGITERNAFSIVTDLTNDGYVMKEKDGRRNRYRIETHAPLDETVGRKQTVGELLELLAILELEAHSEATDVTRVGMGVAAKDRSTNNSSTSMMKRRLSCDRSDRAMPKPCCDFIRAFRRRRFS